MEVILISRFCLRPYLEDNGDHEGDRLTRSGSRSKNLRQQGMTLIEVIMAVAIFSGVSVLIGSIMVTTFKAQRQAELKYDLQTFLLRLNQEIDCDKTFNVGEVSALYNFEDGTFPSNATCGYLTLKNKNGDVLLAPNPSAMDNFVGSGAISKNWWAMAECDEAQRSVTLKVALRQRGSWTEFGKNPLREPKDATDTQHYMTWSNAINPIFGGPGRPKLCEHYFANTSLQRQSCPAGQYATGYNSNDFRCAPLLAALPSPAGECGTGQVMTSFNMRTNTPVCHTLTTADLDANANLASWIRGQLVPQCYNGQFFMADGTTANTVTCGAAFSAIQCNNSSTSDYFPGSSTACNSMSGYLGSAGSLFDFRQIQYMSNSN